MLGRRVNSEKFVVISRWTDIAGGLIRVQSDKIHGISRRKAGNIDGQCQSWSVREVENNARDARFVMKVGHSV